MTLPLTTTLHQPSDQSALVTFVRPSPFAFAVEVSMWDGEQFFGMLNSQKVLQYKASPGEHLFIARADNWSDMKATLEAGKQYYVVAKMFPGKNMFFGIGVALNPVLKDGDVTAEQIEGWVSSGKPRELVPEQREAFEAKLLPQVREAIGRYEAGEVEFATLAADDNR